MPESAIVHSRAALRANLGVLEARPARTWESILSTAPVTARPLTDGQRSAAAIAAATALNLPFGTIYAFSVFLRPMEAMLGIGRTEMSTVFALATLVLTAGMNLAPYLYRYMQPASLVLVAGAGGAIGLALCATADGFAQLALGYGVLFGFGGGIGFIVVQQGVNQTVRSAGGLVNGFVVSLYPLGAMIGAPLFGWGIETIGVRATLACVAVAIAATSLLSAHLIRRAGIRMHDPSAPAGELHDPQWPVFLRLFAIFFLAAAAGLMVMSQAAGIVEAYGGATVLALGATTLITGAIAAARIGGGWLVDRFSMAQVAAFAHGWSLFGVVALTLWPGPLVAIPALAMIGMGYGFISGSTAASIARYWHRNQFGLVAGQLYIAWCIAAITLPVLAGWLFDLTQGYATAVMIAGAGNIVGIYLARGLPAWRRS